MRASTAPLLDRVATDCPTLARLLLRIGDRSAMLRTEPLLVDQVTYQRAEAEMSVVRKARGYSDLPRAHLPDCNFLLFGVPIVSETQSDG